MRLPTLTIFSLLWLWLGITQPGFAQIGSQSPSNITGPRVAIIIDDIGYSLRNGMRAAQLPAALTLSVIPHTPNGVRLAEAAHQQGKEVMLHAPMSNQRGLPLESGALTGDMDYGTFIMTLQDNIFAIPHVSGLNNHMGSLLTENPKAMSWLVGELKEMNLFFVDSRTSPHTRAYATAVSANLPSLQRDIFLDNERDSAQINGQLDKLLSLARRRGHALAIGHPYPETLAVLEARLPQLQKQGITLVPVSELLSAAPVQISAQRIVPASRPSSN